MICITAHIHMSSEEMSAKGNLRIEMPRRVQVSSGQGKVGDVGRGCVLCEKNF